MALCCHGNLTVCCHGNLTLCCHGNQTLCCHGNLTLCCHGNLTLCCHGNPAGSKREQSKFAIWFVLYKGMLKWGVDGGCRTWKSHIIIHFSIFPGLFPLNDVLILVK